MPGHRPVTALLAALALASAALLASPTLAQAPPAVPTGPTGPQTVPGGPPVPPQTGPTIPAQPGGPTPGQQPPGGAPGGSQAGPLAPIPERAHVTWEDVHLDYPNVTARNVTIEMGEYTLTGARVEGSFERELLFTGNPTLTYRGETVTGDTIRFAPRTRAWSVTNLHSALSPEFLRGQITSPLYLSGAEISGGRRGQPILGEDVEATTCDRPRPDYLIHAAEIKVEPGERITLRRAAFDLWGHRIFTLPTLIIPLNRSPRQLRISHPPQVGHSFDEGWFVKSVFNWAAARHIPALFRLDLMEKKGIGTGIDLDWNTLRAAGALVLYAIPTGGTARNLMGRINQRQNLGGGETVSIDSDYQRQSYLGLPETTTFNSRLGFTRTVTGSNTTFMLAQQSTDSSGYTSRSLTGNIAQMLQLGRTANVNLTTDYSRYTTSVSGLSGSVPASQVTEQLTARLQADQRAPNYLLQLVANRNVPVGRSGTGTSFFSGLERLPELTLSSYRFTHGFLSQVPALFMLSAGRYSEAGTVGFGSQTRTATDRAVMGVDVNDTRFALTHNTDLHISAGFQQFFYGDGSAQYLVRDNTALTQRWGRHSGMNIVYTYQRPEGGTPFRFDQQGQYHTLNTDIGFLDDRRLQLTARVGYDFGQSSLGGFSRPWQTLSANLLVRPVDWMRLRNLVTFDPNSGRVMAVTSDFRIRGRGNFAIDAVSQYDPQRHKIGSLNSYIHLPIGRDWRVTGLFRYNGYLNRFESRNLEIVRDLHCMEASITYIDNPYGFRTDRQIYFQLRIKAFPILQRFGIGQAGQPIDTGVGEIY